VALISHQQQSSAVVITDGHFEIRKAYPCIQPSNTAAPIKKAKQDQNTTQQNSKTATQQNHFVCALFISSS
jgi:hypothetical protein